MYDTIQFESNFDVELIQFTGGDDYVAAAARVSTKGWTSLPNDSTGLIKYLMRNRHGSPFEHGLFTWRISAPIFVWREFMRHRIASFNEESGRYKELEGKFYLPRSTREILQIGKPGNYRFTRGSVAQEEFVKQSIIDSCKSSYYTYKNMLDSGIAKEVARMVLPVNIYSTAWVTMNPRGLMNFLSLRTADEDAIYKSTPMKEIETIAWTMAGDFLKRMPETYNAFREAGSVCP